MSERDQKSPEQPASPRDAAKSGAGPECTPKHASSLDGTVDDKDTGQSGDSRPRGHTEDPDVTL